MITSMDIAELTFSANQLGLSICDSEPFHEYIEKKKALLEDKEAQQLIQAFSRKKELYDDVQRFGKYHPDYDTISRDIREAKRTMDVHPAVAQFKDAEKELESLLNDVAHQLAHAVSPFIKVPTGNPFFDSIGCSGGCGSGGGCSCSA